MLRSEVGPGCRSPTRDYLGTHAALVNLGLVGGPVRLLLGPHLAPVALIWLRLPGGKLNLPKDRDGLYLLLRGLSAVWQTAATLAFISTHPFPRGIPTCG